ncbi:S-type pyocin domain-containing protein [Pseudomonas sp. P108]|uniref:S-type pyocin domain-containing protein n=1 Tax=Pseudomonas sp. P108 TaxID=1837993 RepID=UPI002934EB7D|nr:S-type pyocin domain-containing protein [Pseudomonas sp. P108]WNZ85282.1 S-type pyocin domain-containing protein [Pseudomonas sp. P108]
MQKPPTWELTEAVHTTAVAPIHIPVASGTSTTIPNSGMFGPHNFGPHNLVIINSKTIDATKAALAQEYQSRTQQLSQTLEHELAATRLEGTTHPLPPAESIIRELGVRATLLQRKTAEFHQKTALANQFYGSDPRSKNLIEFYQKAVTLQNPVMPGGVAIQAWTTSFRAAYDSQLLAQSIAILNQQQVNVQNWLATVQGNDRAQAAAAEAQRLAAERARIAVEQQRQRELAEAARVEQARLAALAETQRLAKERARIEAESRREAAEKARLSDQHHQQALIEATRRKNEEEMIRTPEQAQLVELANKQKLAALLAGYSETLTRLIAEARAQSQERTRIAATNSVVGDTDSKAEATTQKLATEQAPLQTKPEQPIEKVQQQERGATKVQHVYPASGVLATNSPVVSFASTATSLSPATSSAILTSLRAGLLTVQAAATALISGPVLVGFAALLMPSRLGNGERFSMSVPLAELSSESAQTLREIADRQGTLELPVGLGVRRLGAGAEIFVATSDDFHIRSSVLVLNAAYDLLNDVYEVALPDSPTDFLTWTPAISPGDSSTESPMVDTDSPAYTGAPIVPIEGRLDLNPILVEGWERFIIVFPDDSGIAPLYVVFSSPYAGGYVKGKYSGRTYNPEQSGGPILDLDWRTAVITQAGVTNVKLHVARFNQSDANDIMNQRLERILKGDLNFTDTDLRYYTHELRELERYRNFGYSDDTSPSEESTIWNNAHTATLEDYKLGSELTLLYNEEAVNAMNAQDEREYQNDMRSFAQ